MTCYFINNLYICVCVLNKYVVSIDLLLTLCILMNKFPTWIDRRMFAGEDGEIYIFSVGRIFYFNLWPKHFSSSYLQQLLRWSNNMDTPLYLE